MYYEREEGRGRERERERERGRERDERVYNYVYWYSKTRHTNQAYMYCISENYIPVQPYATSTIIGHVYVYTGILQPGIETRHGVYIHVFLNQAHKPGTQTRHINQAHKPGILHFFHKFTILQYSKALLSL